jgi:general secretion pathway protein D
MHRCRVLILSTVVLFLYSFAQEAPVENSGAAAAPAVPQDNSGRGALFREMMLQRAAGARDQAVTTQRTAEGGELTTVRQAAPESSEVAVNWENVTLKDCIEVLCRDLGMEFVISPSVNVSQEVSVRAGDVTRWTAQDKQELFDAILETAGVQRVQRGRVWVFSPSDIRPVVESFTDGKYGDGKPVIGVIKLKSIDASQAEQFLNTVGGKPPRVFAMKGSRMILVLGTQQFLSQMEELVKLIDFPPGVLSPYTLEYASSDDMAKELAAIFYGRTGGNGEALRFISVARLNVVVAHNVPEAMLDEVTKWVALLDRADDENERVTRVYRLQVIEAETIGKTLDSLYSTLYKQTQSAKKPQSLTSTAGAKKAATAGNNAAAKPAAGSGAPQGGAAAAAPKADATPKAASVGGASQTSPDMEEEAVILSDKDTNTLIINATPDQHRDIERTIQELDRPRRQVLIETVLVEVTLDEGMNLGVEWALSKGLTVDGSVSLAKNMSGNVPNNTPGNNEGFSYLLKSSSEKLAFIQAAQNDDRLQVLSSPTVLTRDGMQAQVSFGQEVPIQEKSTSGNSSTRDNYSYTYRDAKITLTVTPVIDDNKMVTLNLTQVLRQLPPDYQLVPDQQDNVVPPIFTTRELSSNLQVENGQTLVLGGLIKRDDQKVKRGIPWLSRIPVVGWLFGWESTVKKGSEILMILTPHVVDTREETDLLTSDFRSKILGAMSEKDIRTLYNLEEAEPPAAVKTDAEGN